MSFCHVYLKIPQLRFKYFSCSKTFLTNNYVFVIILSVYNSIKLLELIIFILYSGLVTAVVSNKCVFCFYD